MTGVFVFSCRLYHPVLFERLTLPIRLCKSDHLCLQYICAHKLFHVLLLCLTICCSITLVASRCIPLKRLQVPSLEIRYCTNLQILQLDTYKCTYIPVACKYEQRSLKVSKSSLTQWDQHIFLHITSAWIVKLMPIPSIIASQVTPDCFASVISSLASFLLKVWEEEGKLAWRRSVRRECCQSRPL